MECLSKNQNGNENEKKEVDANGELIFMDELDEDCKYSAALYEKSEGEGEIILELSADTWERDYFLQGEVSEQGCLVLKGKTPEGYLNITLYSASSQRWYGDYEESYLGELEKGFCRLLLDPDTDEGL